MTTTIQVPGCLNNYDVVVEVFNITPWHAKWKVLIKGKKFPPKEDGTTLNTHYIDAEFDSIKY